MNDLPSFSTDEDALDYIKAKSVRIVNLCHIPEDGRIKTLTFSADDTEHIRDVLENGERVDGSNLFSFLEPGRSDIYIRPSIRRAFINPFAILPTLNIMCSYFNDNGELFELSPQSVLARAEEKLMRETGIALEALAELEFYVLAKPDVENLFPAEPDRNYHESTPFSKFEEVRNRILAVLSAVGITTKYGHAEVGRIVTPEFLAEQQEIELNLQPLNRTAENISITKWIIRNSCAQYGVSVSFSPKINTDHMGTGMHMHLRLVKDEKNITSDAQGTLSRRALEAIGGILKFAPSLPAFGNPAPVSYLRFSAHKESPMQICWGERNRMSLIRIPLWGISRNKIKHKNVERATFEYRASDAFANPFLLLAGLTTAVNYGIENADEALELCKKLHVEIGTTAVRVRKDLPLSCAESADNLRKDRKLYESYGVFPPRLVEKTIENLKDYSDKDLWKRLVRRPKETSEILKRYLHYG